MYLELAGKDAVVRPWGWIASVRSTHISRRATPLILTYFDIGSALPRTIRCIPHATIPTLPHPLVIYIEAIFIQLVLQHVLRIRVVAETKTEATPTPATTPLHPKTLSIAPPAAGSHADADLPDGSGSGSDSGGSDLGQTAAELEPTAISAAAPPSAGKEVTAKDAKQEASGSGQGGKTLTWEDE